MSTAMDHATAGTGARFVGQRVARKEDVRFITGRGEYVDDIVVPGTLHAAFARSDVARGTVVSVDTSGAAASPGVHAVLVAADLNHLVLDSRMDQELGMPQARLFRLLADGDVRSVGEPVAMVIADSRYLAEDAVELIEIVIDPLPPLVDYERALDEDAPIVHPELGTNATEFAPAGTPDLEDVLSSAPVVLTETFRQHRYTCVPMETRGMLASWDPFMEELTVWASTQGPHGVRSTLSRLLDHPESKIRVIMPDVGGAFGLKMFPLREEMAVVLATRHLGRPVKWIEDRHEHLMAGPHSREEQVTLTFAADTDGRFLAAKADFLESLGAYELAASSAIVFSRMLLPGPYRMASFGSSGRAVHTNTSGRTGYRGPWMIETVVREQMIDVLARHLGIDPLELRRRNVVREEDLPYAMATGMVFDQITTAATLDQAAELLGYEQLRAQQAEWRAEGRLVGIGIGLLCEPSAMAFGPMSSEAATVRIGVNGQVDVQMSTISNGQSLETTVAQVVADELGVDLGKVRVMQGDTDTSPIGGGSGGSRAAVFASGAARGATRQLRERVIAIAGHLLEAAPEDLEMVDDRVQVVGTPTKGLSLAEVATKAYYEPASLPPGQEAGLEAHLRYTPDNFCTWSNSCHMCLCEVDRDTGEVSLLRYVVSEDCGVMINPNVVEGQIAGGVVQGIGGVLYENLPYDENGNPLATTFVDYLLPTAAEVPEIEYGHIETPSPTNAGGHKGLGEGGAIVSPAAVCNAVSDALAPLGVAIRSQPLAPADVVGLIEAAATTA